MKKKIVSLTLATAMCVCMPASVFAANPSTGSALVETEGNVNYLDTDIYEVTLPTDDCFNFTVDPQGILSATEPETYEDTEGQIVAPVSGGAFINNKSSVPIKLTVDAYVTDGANASQAAINLMDLDKIDVVNSGIDNNMILTLDITNDNIATASAIKDDSVTPDVIAVTHNGVTSDSAISFALQEAPYKFEKSGSAITYEMDGVQPGDSVGMRLGGFVNTQADWKDFSSISTPTGAKKVVVTTVFSFEKLAMDYDAAALDGRAYATLGDAKPEYYNEAARDAEGNRLDQANDGDAEFDPAAGALEIPFDFGSGIDEVSVKGITLGGQAISEDDYKVMNGVITFKSTGTVLANAIATSRADGSQTKDLIITTSDNVACKIVLAIYGTATN